MPFQAFKQILLKIPGAKQARAHLVKQGHSDKEADTGGLVVAVGVVIVTVVIFNSFVFGVIRTYFNSLWDLCSENPTEATAGAIFGSIIFLGILFRVLGKSSEKKKETADQLRRKRHQMEEKKDYLRKGAMGNFEEIFRFFMTDKYPEIEIKQVHVVNMTPRIAFQVKRFNTELGGDVSGNYQLFRESLFADILRILEVTFGLAESMPAVIVDGMMNFISGKAKYYDGTVVSVRAQRNVYDQLDKVKTPPFKLLTSFEFRYNDGMEVKPVPAEEDKSALILEKIKENAPKLDIQYVKAKTKVEDGWEKPPAVESHIPLQETTRGKELSSMPLAQFKEMVTGLLVKMGFDVKKVKSVPGGTLQVQADFSHPVLGGNYLVLARQFPETAPVHADLVRELDEVTREESCKRGIYIVTAQFTEEAKNITKKLAVDLVDGKLLNELLEAPAYDNHWTFRIVDEKGVVTDLSRMSLLNFEQEVDQFLKSVGFRVEKLRRVPGGSVIAVVTHPHPIVGGKFAVMAKQFPEETRIPAELVSEFAHVMKAEFCHRGLLLVPCGLSMEAMALARFSGVDLVDRNLWENLRRHR